MHDFSVWLITGSNPAYIKRFRSNTGKDLFSNFVGEIFWGDFSWKGQKSYMISFTVKKNPMIQRDRMIQTIWKCLNFSTKFSYITYRKGNMENRAL